MHYRYQVRDKIYEIQIERNGDHFEAVVNGEPFRVEVLDSQPGEISLKLGDQPITLYWALDSGVKWVSSGGCTYKLEKPAPRGGRRGAEGDLEGSLRAPMPAQVRSVHTCEGAEVSKGDTLIQLEAMKMEIRLKASRDGVVKRLLVQEGDAVERDQVLIELEPV